MPLLNISHFQQRSRSDCLAACVMMALSEIDLDIAYKDLIQLLRISDAGAPYSHLHYLEKVGFNVTLERGDLAILKNHLAHGIPPIVFVNTSELPYWDETVYHAVVLVGLDGTFAYLNDPAFEIAPQKVSIGDFDLAWFEMGEDYAILQKSRQ